MSVSVSETTDLAVVGLAVMGRNLVLNFCDQGYRVAVYNRSHGVTREFIEETGVRAGSQIVGCQSLQDLVASLRRPRKVLLLVKAGNPVDAVISDLRALLEADDIIVDLGNSQYQDTERRLESLAGTGLRYVGCGISGGEAGARYGPALMPGGDAAAWPELEAMLTAVAARAKGEPCVGWVGPGGAGHFIKMVHNGIEYGDMQLICESYDLLKRGLGLANAEMAPYFQRWNQGPLQSYLIEITGQILGQTEADGVSLVDLIVDTAGQKGTGIWTGIEAYQRGVPVPLIGEAVSARALSGLKALRVTASKLLAGPATRLAESPEFIVADLEKALYAAKIVSYAQGFMLMQNASEQGGWQLDLGRIAAHWRAGCIIRSQFLDEITSVYAQDHSVNIMLAPFFRDILANAQKSWRSTVSRGITAGIPMPTFSSSLSFYDGFRSERLPANLLQAQRDYFGAHGFERLDREQGQTYHGDWGESVR